MPIYNYKKMLKTQICYIILFIIGCSTTKPNISAIYKIPSIYIQHDTSVKELKKAKGDLLPSLQDAFIELYNMNPIIAIEVGKLPEFQGEIGIIQELSLRRFIDIYKRASQAEKDNLNELLNIGKPEFRRYSTPLQAIIWLLEKKDYDASEIPLKHDLRTLLRKSWDFSEKDRWSNFDVVTDRLNDPHIIDFYEQNQFSYERRGRSDKNPDIRYLFYYKKGDCIDITEFTIYCLRKAGYKASSQQVPSQVGNWDHYRTQFEMNGEQYIMDNV